MSFFKLALQQTLLTGGSVSAENTEMNDVEVIAGEGDDTVYVQGSNNKIDVGSDNDIVYVSGGNNDVKGTSGDKSTIVTGNNNTVDYEGDGVHNTAITGDNNTYKAGNGDSTVYIEGQNNTYKVGSGETQNIAIKGDGNSTSLGDAKTRQIAVEGNSNSVETGAGETSASVEGNSNYIAWGDGDVGIYIKGDSNTIKAGNSEQQYIEIEGSDNAVETGYASLGRVLTVKGDLNSVSTGDGDTQLTLEGNTNEISVGMGEQHYAEIKGDENTVNIGDGKIYSEIEGNSNNVTFGDGDKTVYMKGDSNNMSVGDGDTYMELKGSNNNLKFGDGNNTVGFFGNKNNVEFGDGNNYVAFWGDSNSIKAGNGDNFIESLDLALQRGNFSSMYDDWFASLPTSTWSETQCIDVDVDVHVKKKSTHMGLKKKTIITTTTTYTWQENTYKRYHVNGPTNTTIELGSGNNTVAVTGGAKVKAGKNTKVEKCAAWSWDELINSRTWTTQTKTVKKKSKWNWSGIGAAILTGGASLVAQPLLDSVAIGISGRPLFTNLVANTVGLVSHKVRDDLKLSQEGARKNKIVKAINTGVVVAAGIAATIVTAGAAAPAAAAAVGGVLAGTVAAATATTAAVVAGTAAAATATAVVGAGVSMASATTMSGINGQQISERGLLAAAGAGAVGALAGGVTALGVGSVVGTSTAAGIATTAAAAGFAGGVTGSATNQLIMNNGFNSREMWKSGAIGAGSSVAMAGLTAGWNAGVNAFEAAQANEQGFWSSLGDGLAAGGRTALNTVTGGLTEGISSNVFGTTHIDTINTQNAIKVAEENILTAKTKMSDLDNKLVDTYQREAELTPMDTDKLDAIYAERESIQSQIDAYQKQIDTYNSQIDSYNKALNADYEMATERLNGINEKLDDVVSKLESGFETSEQYDALNAQYDNLRAQQTAWSNYANEAQNGAVSWSSRYAVNALDNNPVTSAIHATFNNTVLDAPLSFASNTVQKAGEAVVNTGKAIYDGAAWIGEQAVNTGKAVVDGAIRLGGETADLTSSAVNGISDAVTSVKNTVSEWFSSDNTVVQNANTSSQTEKSWLQKTGDWFKDTFSFGSDNTDALTEAYNNQDAANKAYESAKAELQNFKDNYINEYNSELELGQKIELEYLESQVNKAYQNVFDANAKVDELLYAEHDFNTNSNGLLSRISDAGQSITDFLNRADNTFTRNLLDLTGVRTATNIAGRGLRYFTDNVQGWGAKLDYTISNTFTKDAWYGIKPLYELSGAKALMGAANDALGYTFGSKFTNTEIFGANAANKVTNTLWSDAKSIFTPTETNQGNIFERVGHLVSNAGGKVYNFLNAGGNLVSDVIGLTPVKGVVGLIGQGMKTAFGNEYGWGSNLKYTISGKSGLTNVKGYDDNASLLSTIDNKGLSSGIKYTADATWDLSGAKNFYELGDKSLLYLTDNSNFNLPNQIGEFRLSGVNSIENTIVTDGTAFGNGLIKAGNMLKSGFESTTSYLGDKLGEFGDYLGSAFDSSSTSTTAAAKTTNVKATTNPIAQSSGKVGKFWGSDLAKQLDFAGTAQYANLSEYGTPETVYSMVKAAQPTLGSRVVSGMTNAYNSAVDGLSAIKTNFVNNLSTPSPTVVTSSLAGVVGAQTYTNEKRISERKNDLSKLSVR